VRFWKPRTSHVEGLQFSRLDSQNRTGRHVRIKEVVRGLLKYVQRVPIRAAVENAGGD
jgi:hypothetical protein